MMAVFIAASAVAVERFINRRRLRIYEVARDVGWLTLMFALIEFAYLFVVEAATLSYGAAVRPLWYTEWPALKSLLLDAAVGVLLVLVSVWLESAGIELRLRRQPVAKAVRPKGNKCDIEWHEAA